MSYGNPNPYASSHSGAYDGFAIDAQAEERSAFIRRTYLHLAGAIAAFALIEVFIFNAFWNDLDRLVVSMLTGYNWLFVLGAFLGVSFLANAWATSATSTGTQYAGLSLYVIAEAILFVPLLYIANRFAPGAIQSAAILTGIIFGGLTLAVFTTKADFSWLRMYLWLGGLGALGFIVCAILFQADGMLGTLFSTAMIVLAAGFILYDTSNVLHRYRTSQHVAAALALFASVALLFWYVLQLVMSSRR